MSCKLFRIGVFFDGTGNNKANDKAGKSGNGPSNIAILSDLYRQGTEKLPTGCEMTSQMVYIEGVGTLAPQQVMKKRQTGTQYAPGAHGTIPTYEWFEETEYQEDYAMGLGAGDKGAERINRAIDQVWQALDAYDAKMYRCVIDVFGFSRGAAMARDFINTLKWRYGHRLKYEIGFVGIFDTVGSFGAGGDDIDLKPRDSSKHVESETMLHELKRRQNPSLAEIAAKEALDRKRAVWDRMSDAEYEQMVASAFESYNFNLSAKSAKRIVHLVAADEYRQNFPLTNIKGSAGRECYMIGVHSDIGGGYPAISHEKASFSLPALPGNPAADASNTENRLGGGWQCQARKSSPSDKNYRLFASSYILECQLERTVPDSLQKVALQAMYQEALMMAGDLPGCPFDPPPPAMLAPDLRGYWGYALSNLGMADKYPDKKAIMRKYAHRSGWGAKDVEHMRNISHGEEMGQVAKQAAIVGVVPTAINKGKGNLDTAKAWGGDLVGNSVRYSRGGTLEREAYDNNPNKAIV